MCLCVYEKISKDVGVSHIIMYFKENSVGAKSFWCEDTIPCTSKINGIILNLSDNKLSGSKTPKMGEIKFFLRIKLNHIKIWKMVQCMFRR